MTHVDANFKVQGTRQAPAGVSAPVQAGHSLAGPFRFLRSLVAAHWSSGVLCLLAGILLGVAGCSTPRDRYQVLSYFFDGVPDPDAAAKYAAAEAAATRDGQDSKVLTVMVVSQHKPYVNHQCDACHRSAKGEILEFEQAYDACGKCHKKVSTEHTRTHGPVAREACKFCHTPHDSAQPALLKDTPIKVCTPCHTKELLGDKPAEHTDGTTSCLKCHFGHGGEERYFLKGAASRPATQAAGEDHPQPRNDDELMPMDQGSHDQAALQAPTGELTLPGSALLMGGSPLAHDAVAAPAPTPLEHQEAGP